MLKTRRGSRSDVGGLFIKLITYYLINMGTISSMGGPKLIHQMLLVNLRVLFCIEVWGMISDFLRAQYVVC